MNNKLIGNEKKTFYSIMMKMEIYKLKYYLKMRMFG